MKRSRNEYSELNFSKIELIKRQYSKQGNSCVSLVRRSKKLYYSNLNGEKVTVNKMFWKTNKPLLSDKILSKEKLTWFILTEKNEPISNL